MATYYRTDGQRLSYAEYWRMSSALLPFLVVAGMKLLRVPVKFNFAILRQDCLNIVPREHVSETILGKLAPAVQACVNAGFRECFHQKGLGIGCGDATAVAMLSGDGQTRGMAIHAGSGVSETIVLGCVSRLTSGRYLGTGNAKMWMKPEPRYDVVRLPGASAEAVLERHTRELRRPGRKAVVLDREGLERDVLEGEQSHYDFHVGRGVYVPMTEEEVIALRLKLAVGG